MWLPKDERKLLRGYSWRIREPEKDTWFRMSNWLRVFKSWRTKATAKKVPLYVENEHKEDLDIRRWKKAIKNNVPFQKRFDIANAALEKRGLIRVQKHQHEPDVAGITLTMDGYDLGRKYSKWFIRSGQWFAEYRYHWIWIILAYGGGILTHWIVRCLWKSN